MKAEEAVKYAAIVFLLFIGISCSILIGYNTIYNLPVPDYIKVIVTTGITYAVTALGYNHGANIALKGPETNGKHT